MTSVTLDTNIYVSALEFGGIGARLIGMARAGMIRIDSSDLILDELISVLRDDFHWEGYRLHFAKEQLARFLECAIEAGSDFIITADDHLLRLGQYEGIPIMRPEDFLKRAMVR